MNVASKTNFGLFFDIIANQPKKQLAEEIAKDRTDINEGQALAGLNNLIEGQLEAKRAEQLLPILKERYGEQNINTLLTTTDPHRVGSIAISLITGDSSSNQTNNISGQELISGLFDLLIKMKKLMKQIQEQVEGFKEHWSKVMIPMIKQMAQAVRQEVPTENIATNELAAITEKKSEIEILLDKALQNVSKLRYVELSAMDLDSIMGQGSKSKKDSNPLNQGEEFNVARRFLETIGTLTKSFEEEVKKLEEKWKDFLPSINQIKESFQYFGKGKIDLNFDNFASELSSNVKALIGSIQNSIKEPIKRLSQQSGNEVKASAAK